MILARITSQYDDVLSLPASTYSTTRFYANVIELSKVLIERGYRHVFGRRSRGNQTVHEMDLCCAVAIQGLQVDGRTINFDSRAGNESAECRCDISAWMLVERLQYEHALGQNSRQHYNHHVPAITGIEQLSSGFCMLFMVLH